MTYMLNKWREKLDCSVWFTDLSGRKQIIMGLSLSPEPEGAYLKSQLNEYNCVICMPVR